MQKTQNSFIVIIFSHLAIIFTILAQILEIQSIMRPLMFACWSVTLIYALLARRVVYINSYIKTFIIAMLFILFHNIVCFFIYEKVEISNYFQTALIPLFVFFTMFQIAGYINLSQFKQLLKTYCIFAVGFAIYININYIPSISAWLTEEMYIYSSKNSAAQIYISATIIMLFYFKSENRLYNILRISASVYLIILSLLLQCRTAILGLACVFIFHLFVRSNFKKRIIYAIIILLALLVIFTNQNLFEFFKQALGFNRVDSNDLNVLSSGRLDLWAYALKIFSKRPLIGTVSYYVDCMYISAFTALGIFGGAALMLPWFKRISKNFKSLKFASQHKTSNRLEVSICYLTIYYLITSSLEGLPPFGPGACSAMFWLMCSYMDYTYYKPPTDTFKKSVI